MSNAERPSAVDAVIGKVEESVPYQAASGFLGKLLPSSDSLVGRGIVVGLAIAIVFVLLLIGISSCASCGSSEPVAANMTAEDAAQIEDEATGTTKLDVLNKEAVQRATVVDVIDGDTIRVKLGPGYREGEVGKVRLIGIDTPESVHPDESRNSEEGRAASNYTKMLVSKGDTVWLTADESDVDKYGRWLRYVWINDPRDGDGKLSPDAEPETDMLNAILVKRGYAVPKMFPPDTKYAGVFDSLG